MVEYGKPAPPNGRSSLNKLAAAFAVIMFVLIGVGVRQCQGRNELSPSNAGDEKIKALEEKIKELESRANSEQQPLNQQPEPKPEPQPQALSANDIDEYNRNINFQKGLINVYNNSYREYRELGAIEEMRKTTRKSQIASAMAECLERYRNAAEAYYKANTACLAEANNTPALF